MERCYSGGWLLLFCRYPGGKDSYFVDESDVKICWEAVKIVKKSVDRYLENERKERKKRNLKH